jgi:hypothetical protein
MCSKSFSYAVILKQENETDRRAAPAFGKMPDGKS